MKLIGENLKKDEKMKKESRVYLRVINMRWGNTIEIFEGNIKEDKKYLKKYQNLVDVRYFELTEEMGK